MRNIFDPSIGHDPPGISIARAPRARSGEADYRPERLTRLPSSRAAGRRCRVLLRQAIRALRSTHCLYQDLAERVDYTPTHSIIISPTTLGFAGAFTPLLSGAGVWAPECRRDPQGACACTLPRFDLRPAPARFHQHPDAGPRSLPRSDARLCPRSPGPSDDDALAE
jgi:hypothetical protein